MRTTLITLLLVIVANGFLLSQDIRLVEYKSEPDHSKNIDKTGPCVLKKELKGDVLTVELLSRNMQYSVTPNYTMTYKKGVLRITPVLPETRLPDTVYYDKKLRKKVILHSLRMDYSVYSDLMGPKAKREVFRFKGFKSCPQSIYLNTIFYPACPGKDIEFRIYKGDTINRINGNGYKQGLWITFYDTGEVHERKRYVNGAFQGGKTFDKAGKDLHYVSESEGGISSFQVDSLFNKQPVVL